MISSFHLPESSAKARRISSCMFISFCAMVRSSILTESYSSYLLKSILFYIFAARRKRAMKCASKANQSEERMLLSISKHDDPMATIYTYWISTALLSLLYLTSAFMYLTKGAWVRQALADLGYPAYFVPLLITVKVLGAA